jgi:uncharacterized protein YlxW (UPF0749 family)
MFGWDQWKKGFDQVEDTTARYVEQWLKSPLVLGPSGKAFSEAMKVKASTDRAVAQWWGMVGLPTKRDQERTLHLLNQMQSRLIDLEEQLADTQVKLAAATRAAEARAEGKAEGKRAKS